MRFKKIGIILLSLFVLGATTACDNDNKKDNIEESLNDKIKISYEGALNINVDSANKEITIKVNKMLLNFDLDKLLIKNGSIKVYEDGSEAKGILILSENTNTFTCDIILDSNVYNYTLKIIRDGYDSSELVLLDLVLDRIPTTVYCDDGVVGELGLLMSDGTTSYIPLTPDMVKGFDPFSTSDHSVTISYGDKSKNLIISVVRPTYVVDGLFNQYEKDSELNEDIRIIKNYKDKSEEIKVTPDMIEGFDTSTVGTKTIKITYEDYVYETNILVYEEEVEVIDFKLVYALNEEFTPGKIEVRRGNDSQFISITLDMVEGFDTSSVGKKDVVIKYKNKTFNYTIEVCEYNIELLDIVSKYKIGDDFKGGQIKVEFHGNTEIIEITPTMLDGFNTKSAGTFDGCIKYNGVTINFKYTVLTEEEYSLELYRELYLIIPTYVTLMSNGTTNFDEDFLKIYNELYLDMLEDNLIAFIDALNESGVADKVEAILDILKDEGYKLVKFVTTLDLANSDLIKELTTKLTENEIKDIKSFLLKTSKVFSDSELARLIEYVYNFDGSEPTFNINIEGISNKVKLSELPTIIGIDSITTVTSNLIKLHTLTKDDYLYMATTINMTLEALSAVKVETFMALINELKQDTISDESLIKVLGVFIYEVINGSSSFKMTDIMLYLVKRIPAYGELGMHLKENMPELIKYITRYKDALANLFAVISDSEVQALKALISRDPNSEVNDADLVNVLLLIKKLDYTFSEFKDDLELQRLLNKAFNFHNISTLDSKNIFMAIHMLANIKLPNLDNGEAFTAEEKEYIMTMFGLMLMSNSDISVTSSTDAIIKQGSTLTDLILEINLRYKVAINNDSKENIITISEDIISNRSEVLESLKTPGIYNMLCKIGNNTIKLQYVVYDKLNLMVQTNDLNYMLNFMTYYDEVTHKFLGASNSSIIERIYSLDEIIAMFDIKFYIEELNYIGTISKDIDEYTYIVGNEGYGGLKVDTKYGSVTIPLYSMAIGNINILGASVEYMSNGNDISINAPEETAIYILLNNDLIFKYQLIDITKLDSVGIKNININILGHDLTFELNVVE